MNKNWSLNWISIVLISFVTTLSFILALPKAISIRKFLFCCNFLFNWFFWFWDNSYNLFIFGIEFIAFKHVKLFDMLSLVVKMVIVKNLYDVLSKMFALITQVQPQRFKGVKQTKRCQWDNMNHTYLLRELLLGEYFHKRPQKNLLKFWIYFYIIMSRFI